MARHPNQKTPMFGKRTPSLCPECGEVRCDCDRIHAPLTMYDEVISLKPRRWSDGELRRLAERAEVLQ